MSQAPSPADTFVVVSDVSRRFDVSKPLITRLLTREPKLYLKAVDAVSLDVKRGETLAIVGESGSGKSTLANIMVGLLTPSAGEVSIDGYSMSGRQRGGNRRAIRKRIQMVFQDPFASLNPRWRVGKIVAEPIRAFGLLRGAAINARVGELLELVGLHPDDAKRFPHEFSGGQRQRIAIARALASEADFLVYDEPTSALDVSVQAQILNLMRDLQDQLGLTYVLISHNLAVVRHMATRIAVMYLGRIVEVQDAHDLFSAPLHPYTRMLLAALPDMKMSGRPRIAVKGEIPSPINPPSGCHFHTRCPYAEARCSNEVPAMVGGVACHGIAEGRIPAFEVLETTP
jgi:peptide/nickel transport system ATP-binding protein